MVTAKYIEKFVAVIMVSAVLLCLCAIGFADTIANAIYTSITMEYEAKLFTKDEPISVNVIIDTSQWENMLQNSISEEYYQCDVEVAGSTFYRVGIRPKGNTSLSSIANDPDTDRYSFKLEFDQYVDGQTCFGLDKLVLNNSYADATYMKEALIYDMYSFLGADSSLYNYAKLYINGEYYGLYLALEAVEDSLLLRNYGAENGELYKPDSMEMGGQGGFGGFGGRGGGSNLNYSDDDPDSYTSIWDGEVTKASKTDNNRVVTALKNISQGTDLEKYMDIDNLVKYMAVHIFSENNDSLSGSMAHNYYLYESGGQLNLLPWDYNLAFGGMGMGRTGSGATDVVNAPIDDAWSGTDFFDTLLADEVYHAAYYEMMEKLVNEYFLGGQFETFYNNTRGRIEMLVQYDPTAFYTYDEYTAAAETLYEVVSLRAQSVKGQLEGTIPSTANEQRNSAALIDASHLDVSVMGTMSMGGGFGNREMNSSGKQEQYPNTTSQSTNGGQMMPDFGGQMPGGFDGQMTGGAFGQMPEGFDPSQFGGQMPGGVGGSQQENNGDDTGDQSSVRPNMQGQSDPFGGKFNNKGISTQTWVTYALSAVLITAAFIFAALYRRRPRKR